MEAPGPAAAGPEPPETRAEAPDGAPQPPAYRLQDFDTLATVGTGTFGRVQLVKEKTAKHFFALKVMSIPDVIRLKQEQHVHNEKSVLKEVSHPFLVKLFPPFFDDNPFGIYQKILAGKIDFPRHLDFNVKDLIKKLLVVDRTRRLGNMKNGADDVKRHRWFRSVDWEAVPQRKLKPPIVPKVCSEGDTSNFETYPENDWNTAPPVSPKDLEVFKNF
nr:cAMP-dependent protein kinase catalytic subunit PRKX isoform X2 [Manis javanica]